VKFRKEKIIAGLAALLFLGVGLTFAQSVQSQGSLMDRRFLQDMAAGSAWKVRLGELALRQAANGDIKVFSELMIAEQKQMLHDLERIADRKGIPLSRDADAPRRNTLIHFSQEYGAAFDRGYISLMLDEHQRDAALCREEIEKGKDADVRTFASQVIERIEKFISMAKQILLDLPKPVLK
jgi:putative membrane protein